VVADLDPRRGGAGAACLGMAKAMARRGHEVRIITTDRGYDSASAPQEPSLAIEALPGNWPDFFGTSWAMRHRLGETVREADVVHIHALYLFHDWAAARWCWRYRKPYIVAPHGALDPFIYRRHRWRKFVVETAFQNEVSRRAAGLHYTTAEEWRLARAHARNSRGSIVSLGVDLDGLERLPSRSALRSRYPAIGDRKAILFLGRLSYKKGVDIVIKAFSEIAHRRNDIFLILAGPDEGIRERAATLIARCGVAERCLFTGMVTGEDKRVVLGGSDIFVLASKSENFGISVVEAAASGIPVVISDRVNIWREFHDAKAGLAAPPTVADFARQLKLLLDNPAAAADIGRRGAAVARRFSWELLAPQYAQMYATAARDKKLPELT
jgi:glycosyltransferase involved in cell wall biosynthesis